MPCRPILGCGLFSAAAEAGHELFSPFSALLLQMPRRSAKIARAHAVHQVQNQTGSPA